jgi:hypothetical protein
MANAGSVVVSLFCNADAMLSGFNAGTEAAKKAANSIGGSIDRINSKQINQAATSILKNMVGPVALMSAGTQMATDLIKGFSTGSIKNWEEAGRGLMESLNKGLQSIPIVGEFAKLGEAIGNAAFGVDKATAAIAETAVQVEKVQKLINSLKAETDLINASKEKIIQRTEDLNKTAAQKEYEQIEKDLQKQEDLSIKAAMDLWEATNKVKSTPFTTKLISEGSDSFRPEYAGMGGGTGPITEQVVNPEYVKELDALQEKKVRYLKEITDASAQGHAIDMFNIAELQTAEQTAIDAKAKSDLDAKQKIQDANDAEQAEWDEMLDWAKEMQKEIEGDEKERLRLIKEREKAEEKAGEVALKARQDARDEAIKGYEDYQKAEDVFAETAAQLDAKSAGASATTSIDTAIGNVKIAGATDFSVQKQMDIAQSTLQEAKSQSDYLKSIDAALHNLGGGT